MCVHDWSYKGVDLDGRAGACQFPRAFDCVHCAARKWAQCYSWDCEHCGPVRKGDMKALFRSGVTGEGSTFFCTLTAPGVRGSASGDYRMRWDTSVCSHGPEVQCSGAHGCVVMADDAALWHWGLRHRWSYFGQFMRRWFGLEVEAVGVWEMQKRGVMHRHVLVRVDGLVSEDEMRAALVAYCRVHQFGVPTIHNDPNGRAVQLLTGDARETALRAGYLAKYLAKTAGFLRSIATGFDADLDGNIARVHYCRWRGWSATAHWGERLKYLRMRRVAWFSASASGGLGMGAGGPDPGPDRGLDLYTEISTRLLRMTPGMPAVGVL